MVITFTCEEELNFFHKDEDEITIESEATNGNIELVNDIKIEITNSSDEVIVSSTATQSLLNKNMSKTNISTVNTAGNTFYPTGDVINGICTRDCAGSDRTDNLPAADSLGAAIPNCQVGTSFFFILRNIGGTDHVLTLNPVGNTTLTDSAIVEYDKVAHWRFYMTNLTPPTFIGNLINKTADSVVPYVNTHAFKMTLSASSAFKAVPPAGFPFIRAASTGSAWSISLWHKVPSTPRSAQVFGSEDSTQLRGIAFLEITTDNKFGLVAGSDAPSQHNLVMYTPNGSVPSNTWSHILVTYDGGLTGGADPFSTYSARFKIYINAVDQTITGTKHGAGWVGAYNPVIWGLGNVYITRGGPNETHYDEIAVFDYSAHPHASLLHNGGSPNDLTTISGVTPPVHWWKATQTDINNHPTLADHVGSFHLTGTSTSASEFLNSDYP